MSLLVNFSGYHFSEYHPRINHQIRVSDPITNTEQQDTLFKDFRIESNNNNEIWLELQLDALLKILKSAESCGESFSG